MTIKSNMLNGNYKPVGLNVYQFFSPQMLLVYMFIITIHFVF